MTFYIIRSSEDGISIDGPLTREQVASEIDTMRRDTGREPVILDKMPKQDKGCFMGVPDGSMVILRGEVVGLDEINGCPCGSGRLFKDCHGQEEPVACAHDKVYSNTALLPHPPQYPWICRKCKARGTDTGAADPDAGLYERLIQEAT